MAGELPPRRVLLVEGVSDKHVVRHLRDRHSDVPQFEILDKGGFPDLCGAIGPEIKASGRLAVGILTDANDDPAARWQEIAGRLRRTQVTPPAGMETSGAVMEGRPRPRRLRRSSPTGSGRCFVDARPVRRDRAAPL